MKLKGLFHAEYPSFAGESGMEVVGLLFTLQNAADLYCVEVPGLVLEAEAYRGDLPVGIGTGDHLYRDIDAKDTFHVYQLLSLQEYNRTNVLTFQWKYYVDM